MGLKRAPSRESMSSSALQTQIDEIEAQTATDLSLMKKLFDEAAKRIERIPHGPNYQRQVDAIEALTDEQLDTVHSFIKDAAAQLEGIYLQIRDNSVAKSKRDKYKLVHTKLDTCSICLDTSRINHGLRCGHAFHKACILPWIRENTVRGKFSCPNCREQVSIK